MNLDYSCHNGYNADVEEFREREYPMLKDTIYLDHAGTTLYAKSLIERFSADMLSTLYGNPHSTSSASQNTSRRVEEARLRLLGMFNASPDEYDVVFVANATAGIKLVIDAFRDLEDGFWYGYHRDAHTSLIGAREVAAGHRCFETDQEVENWLDSQVVEDDIKKARLFAYPAQSNMNGRRSPLSWCGRARQLGSTYSLLDAAAMVSTSPLDLSDASLAPDCTVMSLYKIFGFPDLGALIVRTASAGVLLGRKYFGGGTVDTVVCLKEQWHAKKSESIHDQLEDGTLPIHSIMALHAAMDVHQELYGPLRQISDHCAFLAKRLFDNLSNLRHGNGFAVCEMYKDPAADYSNTETQGPIVAFNIRNVQGGWIANSEVEKLVAVRNIQLRTGGLCNPGGIASSLQLEPWEIKRNFSAGFRCGNEGEIMHGKPTGMIRLSLGAMSTLSDVDAFVNFMEEYFVEHHTPIIETPPSPPREEDRWYVESLTVYPIKSCAGYRIPRGTPWHIHPEGLAWDREWCLVRPGTGSALSQKRYPRMALLRPVIDLERGSLRVSFADSKAGLAPITVPLSDDPSIYDEEQSFSMKSAKVCEDTVAARTYQSAAITDFFTKAVGVACQLARFPAGGNSSRHAKAHLKRPTARQTAIQHIPGSFPEDITPMRPILLSNESPILVISRSSLNRLNEQIKINGGKAVHAEAFRANIIVAEYHRPSPSYQDPYAEDHWRMLQIGRQKFQMLGACRRCQMVCIDQETGERQSEPFSTLAKTRRSEGKVWFGVHACHVSEEEDVNMDAQAPTIITGEHVLPSFEGEEWVM